MPVFNEAANMGRALEEIDVRVPLAKRVLDVQDFDEDTTLLRGYVSALTHRPARGRAFRDVTP